MNGILAFVAFGLFAGGLVMLLVVLGFWGSALFAAVQIAAVLYAVVEGDPS